MAGVCEIDPAGFLAPDLSSELPQRSTIFPSLKREILQATRVDLLPGRGNTEEVALVNPCDGVGKRDIVLVSYHTIDHDREIRERGTKLSKELDKSLDALPLADRRVVILNIGSHDFPQSFQASRVDGLTHLLLCF